MVIETFDTIDLVIVIAHSKLWTAVFVKFIEFPMTPVILVFALKEQDPFGAPVFSGSVQFIFAVRD